MSNTPFASSRTRLLLISRYFRGKPIRIQFNPESELGYVSKEICDTQKVVNFEIMYYHNEGKQRDSAPGQNQVTFELRNSRIHRKYFLAVCSMNHDLNLLMN